MSLYSAVGNYSLHNAVDDEDIDKVIELLHDSEFININEKNRSGNTPLHLALEGAVWMKGELYRVNYYNIIIKKLLEDNRININIKNNTNQTVLHLACLYDLEDIILILLDKGIEIDDNIDNYEPGEREVYDDYGHPYYYKGKPIVFHYTDCRPLIFAEVEHRRKRALFDSFINHHIEYQPYINNIYTLCYPTGNIQVAKPSVGWMRAEAIRDQFYFDDIFLYLHLHLKNIEYKNSSTLMSILNMNLRKFLIPDQKLYVEVPYTGELIVDDDYYFM